MKWDRILLTIATLASLAACTKSGPDNAMTRYGENLARDERRAQEVADKANAAVAQEQKVGNQAANEKGDQ